MSGKTIIISPFAKPMRNGKLNPKEYPWWEELIGLLENRGHHIIQIGVEPEKKFVQDARFNLRLKELKELVYQADTWISIDNFFQHFCALHKCPGFVIFSKSDPIIFGYPENINILKDRQRLRRNQYGIWEEEELNTDDFLLPHEIYELYMSKSQWLL